jgi:hypothetical protein
MAPKWRFISLALIFILPLGVTFVSRDVATAPNSVELICEIGAITTPFVDHQANNHIVLPVYMYNVSDSVAGFTLWIRSDWLANLRFGVASQQGEVLYAKFDTVGTRASGFKFFDARIQDALHGQVKISALCDPDSPRVVKPIPPGSGVLVNLILETTPIDTICDSLPTLNMPLRFDKIQTSFSNPASQTIGCNYVLEVDTTYGCCKTWNSNFTVCLEYWPPSHMCINERWRCASIDTTRLVLIDGSNQFVCGPPCQCGNANGDAAINISDAVFLIAYIFAGGLAPGPCSGFANGLGDANGDHAINISDAVYLISYIFAGGPTPHC